MFECIRPNRYNCQVFCPLHWIRHINYPNYNIIYSNYTYWQFYRRYIGFISNFQNSPMDLNPTIPKAYNRQYNVQIRKFS